MLVFLSPCHFPFVFFFPGGDVGGGGTRQVAEQTVDAKDVEVAVIPPHPFLVPAKEQVRRQKHKCH